MEQLERLSSSHHHRTSRFPPIRCLYQYSFSSSLAFLLVFQIHLMADLIQAKSTLMSSNRMSPFRFRFNGAEPSDLLSGIKRGKMDALDLAHFHQEKAFNPFLLTKPQKRDYEMLQCRGKYDQGIFTKLNRICDDCFNLYREPEVQVYCRSDCFSSYTFRQCLQSLLLEEESDFFLELVEIIGKKR